MYSDGGVVIFGEVIRHTLNAALCLQNYPSQARSKPGETRDEMSENVSRWWSGKVGLRLSSRPDLICNCCIHWHTKVWSAIQRLNFLSVQLVQFQYQFPLLDIFQSQEPRRSETEKLDSRGRIVERHSATHLTYAKHAVPMCFWLLVLPDDFKLRRRTLRR